MASSSDGEAYKGYFNRVNLALGTSLIVLAGACVVIGLVTGWWTAVQIAGIVVGLPAGLIVTAGAFGNAKRQVVVSAEGSRSTASWSPGRSSSPPRSSRSFGGPPSSPVASASSGSAGR